MLSKWVGRREYKHLNTIKVSRSSLLYNHKALQKLHPQCGICPVLKSNAYGHGLKEVAPVFDSMNCPFLVVDSLYEAYELHKLKVKTPILIMGYTNRINFTVKQLPFSVAVFDLDTARTLNKFQPGCKIHLFVDTGMCREGVSIHDLPDFVQELKELKNLNVVGLCSHFADADNPKNQRNVDNQIAIFRKALMILKEYGINPVWRHISASAGSYKIFENEFNMFRIGFAHYGISPLEDKDKFNCSVHLRPALEFTTTLAQIKTVGKGSLVGYNCTFKTSRETVLGLLPAGYYDGVDRNLSNNGYVKIRNKYFPIIGKVSMNMTVIDITELKNPKIGESVIVYSAINDDRNSVSNTSKAVGKIPYEILIHLAESLHRVIVY